MYQMYMYSWNINSTWCISQTSYLGQIFPGSVSVAQINKYNLLTYCKSYIIISIRNALNVSRKEKVLLYETICFWNFNTSMNNLSMVQHSRTLVTSAPRAKWIRLQWGQRIHWLWFSGTSLTVRGTHEMAWSVEYPLGTNLYNNIEESSWC